MQDLPENLTPETHPVINPPYTEPQRHWALDEVGRALPVLQQGRRPSASRTAVPGVRKSQTQGLLIQEGREHEFVNLVRKAVGAWRADGYQGISRVSRDLLAHWRKPEKEHGPSKPLFFAQLEALETLIWLYEAPDAGSFREELQEKNFNYNDGCNRLATSMATGTGKTMVMAMLIVWHTLLYERGGSNQKKRHSRTFVVITPGLTVKERLRELNPRAPNNIYKAQNLVPARYREDMKRAVVKVLNFQSFRQRDLLEGATAEQKKMFQRHRHKSAFAYQRGPGSTGLTLGGPSARPEYRTQGSSSQASNLATKAAESVKESTAPPKNQVRDQAGFTNAKYLQLEDFGDMLERVLGLPSGPAHRRLVVLNDEAHHCYSEVPPQRDAETAAPESAPSATPTREDAQETERARQWFSILKGLHDRDRLLVAHDLSATPYYVSHQWLRFDWIISDYDLHEAMEAGLVKIPRVPVRDNAPIDDVMFRELYEHTRPRKLKRNEMPQGITEAMSNLYESYENRFEEWKKVGHEQLPVLIVVANTISNATELYDWIAGYQQKSGDEEIWTQGAFQLLSNVDENGRFKQDPVTIIVHSEKLEAGNIALTGTGADRMKQLVNQVASARNEEAAADNKPRQADYLRRILATVGKEGEPGEQVRCVVSVGMLTEGWDARTVTHILGFRPFKSRLLCEQVAGRALRRVNHEATEKFAGERILPAEYSEILGIPFHFSKGQDAPPPTPPEKTIEVFSRRTHDAHYIRWPQVERYRRRIQSGKLKLNPDKVKPFDATATPDAPTSSELAGIIGKVEKWESRAERQQVVQYEFARLAMLQLHKQESEKAAENSGGGGGHVPPNLRRYTQLLVALRAWLRHPEVRTSSPWWQLLSPSLVNKALASFLDACDNLRGDTLQITVELAEPPELDTRNIHFETSISGEMPDRTGGPVAFPPRPAPDVRRPGTKRSQLNVAVCDSFLEYRIAECLDSDALADVVPAWVRNLRLNWYIPWLSETDGVWHEYIPDFILRLADCPTTGATRRLVLEGKGFDDPGWPKKREAVLNYWLPGVRAGHEDACAGKWAFLEVRPDHQRELAAAEPAIVCTLANLESRLKQLAEREDAWR